MFTTAHLWFQSWAKLIQYTPFHPMSLISILILTPTHGYIYSNGIFYWGFRSKILHIFLICPFRATWPVHLIRLDLTTSIIFDEDYKLWSSLPQFSSTCITLAQLGLNILLNTLFPKTFNL
jgi:hypothetical protein